MVKIALGVLSVAAMSAAVQVGYDAPAATGYIYRSDNNGPASLIQLGAHSYQQPAILDAPIPLAEPLKAFEAYDLAPLPLPYIAAKPIVVEDAEHDDNDDDDDDDDEESSEYLSSDLDRHDNGHGYEKGDGNDYGEEHHSAHGENGIKEYSSKGHHAEGKSGHYGKEHGDGFYSEGKGEKGSHHDKADAFGKHDASGESYKGGNHGYKKHSSKGEEVTGYHKVFNKDEFKKDHDFYDVADHKGHFNKHGYEKANHGSEKGGHEEVGHYDSGFDKSEFGKEGFHAKGHIDDADQGHSAEEGAESHYSNEAEFGKKGGASHEKVYVDGDDDEDDADEY